MCVCTVTKVMRDGGCLAEKGGAAIIFLSSLIDVGVRAVFFFTLTVKGVRQKCFFQVRQ